MSRLLNLLLTLSVLIMGIANIWLLGAYFIANPIVKTSTLQSTTLLEKLESVKELAVLRENFTSTVHYQDHCELWGLKILGTSRSLLLEYQGVITYGVDGASIDIRVVDRNTVEVEIPHSVILSSYSVVGSHKVIHEDTGIFVDSLNTEEGSALIEADLERTIKGSKEEILVMADERIRQILTEAIECLGMEAKVIFKDR